jgi:7,8-dihydropterin-6-yl-methyl-4-(beta-D-ribofuranosyl)aminobenzene 5'-phosphate synthase
MQGQIQTSGDRRILMNVRITVLCENLIGQTTGAGEHGFSAFIETEVGNFLLDTGAGRTVVENSLALKKDLKTVKRVFLSHGHNDHTGGLPQVLNLTGPVDVHAHPDIFVDRLAIRKEGSRESRRFAGMIYKRSYLEILGARFNLNPEFHEVEKGVYLTGEVPRKTPFEKNDPKLFREMDGKMVPDPLLDDQSVVLDTEKGLVLVFGCAHSGMINTINHVVQRIKKDHFYALLGGTHLGFLDPEQLEESIRTLKGMKVDRIGVSHCTGFRGASRLQQEFGDRFFYGWVGSGLEI